MPKRMLRIHLDNVAKYRRKSMLIDDPSQLSTNLEEDEDEKNEYEDEEPAPKPVNKQKNFLKLNRNNEIERLLLHNSKTLLYQVNHSDFPAFNVGMWPQECDTLTNYPSCAFSIPRPIYVANNHCKKVDLCYKRPMNREFHKTRLRHTRTAYQTAMKNNKAIRSSEKEGIYHTSVYDLAERVFLQPDPYFHGGYDYYFTGGNLCALQQQGYILHAGGEQLQTLTASEFPAIQPSSSLLNVASHKSQENCEIFEVSPLKTSINCIRQNGFIARQRNLISFNYLNDSNQIRTSTQFRTKSTPFISFAQSKYDINTFVVTTMKQHVRLYDLNKNVPALLKLMEISPHTPSISWNTIKPWREHTFLYANEKQFFLIDTRTSPKQWMDEVTSAVDNSICDHISALLPSDFNNLFYVATSHKLHCMDIRLLKKFSFSDIDGAICRWSHQLLYAPLLMDTFRLRQTEYVALSSPIAGDLHICQLSRKRNEREISVDSSLRVFKHIYSSPCLPYQPPTLLEAYENARMAGKCLQPEGDLEARLKCCTTGLTFFNPSENSTESGIGLLLTSNSNGDIFAHTLSKREEKEHEVRCNRQSNEMMAELEKMICSQTQPPLHYTEIKNMKSMRKIFLCKTMSSVNKYDFDAMDNEYSDNDNNANNPLATRPKRLHLGRWQKPLSTLRSYKDALVPNLLSIWDIDVEDEKHIRLGDLQASYNRKPDPELKVKDWLDANVNPNPPMLTIPAQEFAKYNGNTSHISENTINIGETQNTTIDFENVVHSTQIMDSFANISTNFDTSILDISNLEVQIHNETKTTVVRKMKNPKKTKKYVKGFC